MRVITNIQRCVKGLAVTDTPARFHVALSCRGSGWIRICGFAISTDHHHMQLLVRGLKQSIAWMTYDRMYCWGSALVRYYFYEILERSNEQRATPPRNNASVPYERCYVGGKQHRRRVINAQVITSVNPPDETACTGGRWDTSS